MTTPEIIEKRVEEFDFKAIKEYWRLHVGPKSSQHMQEKVLHKIYLKLKEAERQKREEQGKRFVTLMNQALGQTELPESVWKKIAKVNQLILDK